MVACNRKSICLVFALLFFLIGFSTKSHGVETEKNGILIIAHGSHTPVWNEKFRVLAKEVRENIAGSQFAGVEVAFMEIATPDIAATVTKMARQGYSRIIAVPVFAVASSHTLFDIPAILGHYSDEKRRAELREKEIETVRNNVAVTLTGTMSGNGLLQGIIADKVKAMSLDPSHEAVVLLVHGSDEFRPFWQQMISRTETEIHKKTAITTFVGVQVKVGQCFWQEAAPIIREMAETGKKVFVVGAYMGLSPAKLFDRVRGEVDEETRMLLLKLPVIFATTSILPDKQVVNWIISSADNALAVP